ncbi:MAG: serine acetyltransferase [Verrucomicrobia bacterium]|jgi:serine O-acetyltransferase|nr:serine acetyltransferase [Verrucomicrobiota bacterium]
MRLWPHILAVRLHPHGGVILEDLNRWTRIKRRRDRLPGVSVALDIAEMMVFFPEYRSLLYFRLGKRFRMLKWLARPHSSLYIEGGTIAGGAFFQHGFCTIVAARSIGRDCWINQQVTIGYSNANDCPTIGNNVTVSAGAKVIGGVTVGDNVKIGANAVVVKNVPPNCTVVGVPARIVKLGGRRVDLEL